MLISLLREKISYNKILYFLAFSVASVLTALPVLVFNARGGYPSIEFFKWVLTFPIVAYGTGAAVFMFLAKRGDIRFTRIELAWLAIVLILAIQPLVLPVRSIHEWVRNAYFFAALGGAVFVLRNLPIDRALPGILRFITVTGGVSTLFGFMQNLAPGVRFPFILDTTRLPGRFLGNTTLDNLLGVYLALAIIAGAWLLLNSAQAGKLTPIVKAFDFLLLVFNSAGMWKTGSRSAFLACLAGVAALLAFSRSRPGLLKKCVMAMAAIAALAACVMFVAPGVLRVERKDMTRLFARDVLSTRYEGRYSIWLTTLEMIKTAPLFGVGLGNYKWNYLDALSVSREVYTLRPRYTYWAHNEYLQWIAETGMIGGILFFSLLIYCVGLGLRGIRSETDEKKQCLVWSIAALAVLMVDSCFSRPLHHVETAFTTSLALAVISRLKAASVELPRKISLGVSGVMLLLSLSGVILFSQSFQGQAYLGKYFYSGLYIVGSPSEVREAYKKPFLLEDAYLQLTARENYNMTLFGLGDAEKRQLDAIRLLAQYFETQPRYAELNRLMLLYQKRGDIEEARSYFKYYPPDERQRFLEGRFTGRYMMR